MSQYDVLMTNGVYAPLVKRLLDERESEGLKDINELNFFHPICKL